MSSLNILNKINSPDDIKSLSFEELEQLCEELRSTMIETVSKTGGHLSSNLGVVELTVALHNVFDSPKNQFVWDVGHQVYTHKLLTGRLGKFHTLRTEGGISGFSRPDESEHDIFFSGHSSTSIAAAHGLAKAKTLAGDDSAVVAIIGDGALTGGLAYEALNNAGRSKDKLIVILNDNKMSISKNVGSIARYLSVIRTNPRYFTVKANIEKMVNKVPVIGKTLGKFISKTKTKFKNLIYHSTLFQDMGFYYMGPIDGHDVKKLSKVLSYVNTINKPVFLHVITTKGKGYTFAEKKPSEFHGISKFDVETGDCSNSSDSFSAIFGNTLCEIAESNDKICAITAAMTLGTGLFEFSKQFKNRFFDVGIAEEYAVTFACGLSKNGMIPVFAVYSTFLQRCYDQLVHDVALQKQKVIFAIDRAGFVGEDGESHQGIYDVAFLNSIPNVKIYCPSNYIELRLNLKQAIEEQSKENIIAVRYPRGAQAKLPNDYVCSNKNFDVYGDNNADIAIVTYGRIFGTACSALEKLKQEFINIKIIKLNVIKPIDELAIDIAFNCSKVFFFEEGVKLAGISESFGLKLIEKAYRGIYKSIAVENKFIKSASVNRQLSLNGLDEESMMKIICGSCNS